MKSAISAACVLAILAAGCARDPQRDAAKFVASGDGYAARGHFKEAQIEYRNALERTPRDVATQLKLAHAYETTQDYAGAYRAYLRVAQTDPHHAEAQAWLAEFLLQSGRFDDARRHATVMLEIDPKNVRALILLASADAALRDRDGALKWVQQALTIDPSSATAHTLLGTLQLSAGDRTRAKAAFTKATELAPSSSEAWVALAQFHIAVGEFDAAERALQRALAVTSDAAAVHRMLAMFYVGAGRAAEAEPHLKAVADASAPGRVELAEYYAAMNRSNDALVLLDRVVSDPKADAATIARAHLRRAAVWHAAGEREKAHAELTPLLKDEATGADANALMAQLIMREGGSLDDALMYAREAVKRQPNDAGLQYVQATVFLARNELAEAETSLRRAHDLAPQAPQIELALARVAIARRDYRGAVERAERLLAASPSVDAVALLAQAHRAAGEIAKARTIVAGALDRQPKAANLYLELGDIELAAHRPDAARDAYERALKRGSDLARARRGLVAADLAAKRTGAAEARVHQWSADPSPAPDVPLLAAQVHLAAGDNAAALREYERASSTNPKTPGVHTAIGMLRAERGDRMGAQDAYERALQLDPKDGVAANNLAWIYAGQGRRDEALRLAETAHRALGDRPAAVDTLGWMYYLDDAADRAVGLLAKAADANPSNAVYRYHLGAALMKMNQQERGRRELHQALALSSTFDGVDDAKRLLTTR
jgi:tetratricopeptide (TPR) repeat protein